MNILFTSVGRRVELMQAFKEAACQLNIPLVITGADITNTAPALLYCDKEVIVPRIKDENYIPFLLEYCEKEHVDALVPTIDTDLLLLSKNRKSFEKIGTKVFISAEDKVALCRDKRFTADFFHSVGLESPSPVDSVEDYLGEFPAFIKPKDGSSSINAYKVENREELLTYANEVPDYIIQPFIDGTEYTVDIFCDYEGNPVFITPRIRLQVRAGEVLKTQIKNDSKIISEMKQLIKEYKPCGAITVQLIQDKECVNHYIEINPRFGGGAPLSMRAGANSAKALLQILKGEKLKFMEAAANEDAVYSRFDECALVSGNTQPVKAVVFDLDDTLYDEADYVKSGYHAIAEHLCEENLFDDLWKAFSEGKPAIDEALKTYSEEERKECLSIYRNHIPQILLSASAKNLLMSLREKNIKIGIITDGRPEGQRNKIKALGLEKYVDEIIITDELGGIQFRKPCDIAFRIMQRRFGIPFESILYVGDNPAKDFIAPRQLGMQSLCFKNLNGIYKKNNNTSVKEIECLEKVIECL